MILLLIAWEAVPNTTDSLLYHMSRVVHWAQNKSLQHYPTQYHPQHWNPPWAEMAILNLRLLWGNDKLANLVQWFSMLGSMIGVSALTGLLGAGRREQMLSSAFVASIPMAVLQATSTQNDFVTAFWLVCLTYFVVLSKKRGLDHLERLSLALTIGLGLLTKGTFYLYAFPLLLWFFIPRLVNNGFRKSLPIGLTLIGIICILNLGYWTRNIITYGGPLGEKEFIGVTTQLRTTPELWITAITDQVALNFVSSIPRLNAIVNSTVAGIHNLVGVDIGDFRLIASWNHEDLAANPLQMLSVPIALAVIWILKRRAISRLVWQFSNVLLGCFIVFSVVVEYNNYNVRLQLPFFVLWGVVFGAAAYYAELKSFNYLAAVMLLTASIPWLVLNRSRPLIGFLPHTMMGESVIREPPEVVLFANWTHLSNSYVEVTKTVKESNCREVGLKIDSADIEYPYWWLLDAPQSGIRIEAVDISVELERYVDPEFNPCVIICSGCELQESLNGRIWFKDFGNDIVLYTDAGFKRSEEP
jgi:hypothetical protein